MSKEEVFQYIRERTYNKLDKEGNQVKVCVADIIRCLQIREQTVYRNLSKLKDWEEVKHERYKITRLKDGKKFKFKITKWWIANE